MAVDLNVNPYYDDFDEFKNFHQILFRPGYAVQARELTQLQSVLQNQISKFGSHIFKQGSVVIPGNTLSELNVSYVKVQPTFSGIAIDPEDFADGIVVGSVSGIRAKIRKYVAQTPTDPLTFYLSYISGGGENVTSNEFVSGETLTLEGNTDKKLLVLNSAATGFGSLAFIKSGVYFVNGKFVSVSDQSVVMSKYTTTPSCSVLLQISESIVTSNEDSTLLDPSQGSFNFAAPGADRLKVSLTLVTLPLGAVITDDYIELMRFNNGVLELHSRYPSYSELEKSLARRTFDQSGNYLVSGFRTKLREHLKTEYNNGLYTPENTETPGDSNKFIVEVSSGKAYINGLELENISRKYIPVNKAKTTATSTFSFKNEYGKYIYVTGMILLPNFLKREKVDLYNISNTTGGTKVGELRVVGIDYVAGDASTDSAIYKLYVDDLALTGSYTLQDVGSIRFSLDFTGSAIVVHKYEVPSASLNGFTANEIVSINGSARLGTVRYYNRSQGVAYIFKHTSSPIPVKGDFITGGTSGATATVLSVESVNGLNAPAIFQIPKSFVKTTAIGNTYDAEFVTWKTFNVTLDSSGVGSFSITDGTFVSPEVGTIVAVSNATTKIIPVSALSLLNATTLSINAGASYNGATVVVVAQVRKTGAAAAGQPKLKTLTTHTLTNIVPASEISLQKTDIYRIISIISGSDDVTSRYILDNGQTDYYYGLGKIILTGTLPTSNLTIQFEYFDHSGTGNYFSVDSYKTTLGETNDEYVRLAPSYFSKTTNKRFYLGNCIDFRPTVNASNNFNTNTTEAPVVDTFIDTSAQYYIPRIDILYYDSTGTLNVKGGNPSENPLAPSVPENSIPILGMYISEYTEKLSDIIARPYNNFRYRMSDISKIENRVKDLEYYTQLNSLETSILSYDIIDAETGINKFKSGYIVDNFATYNLVCDYFNRYNRCSFWEHILSAPTEDYEGVYKLLDTSSNYKNNNGLITLNYTENKFIEQPLSSRVENLNPFLVFSWEGSMTIEPPSDVWVETQDLPTIFNATTETVEVEVRRVVQAPPPPPVWEPEPAPPAPVPPPALATQSFTFLAGDLGLVSNPNDPNWRTVVTVDVPTNVAAQHNMTHIAWDRDARNQEATTGVAVLNDNWALAIQSANQLLDSAVSTNISQLGLTTSGRQSTTNVINSVINAGFLTNITTIPR